MKKNLLFRFIALLVCLCLLPVGALAYKGLPESDAPITNVQMDVRFSLDPDAFPQDGAADYQGWKTFLDKLSVQGVMDIQQPLTQDVRACFEGGLYLNGEETIPMLVDVHSFYRFFQSPLIRNDGMYFQMLNFLEFMMKPVYYMGLPTNYIALLMYPETSVYLANKYYPPLAALVEGEGERTIPYEDLYNLCLEWNTVYENDIENNYRLFFYLTCLLYDLGVNYDVYEQLGDMTAYLEFLDPEQKGMRITSRSNATIYTVGDTEVFIRRDGEARNFTLKLPDPYGNLLTFTSKEIIRDWQGDNWTMSLSIQKPGEEDPAQLEEYLDLVLDMERMPLREHYTTSGTVTFSATGPALRDDFSMKLAVDMNRTDIELPNQTVLTVALIHPQTEQRCVSATIDLIMGEKEENDFVDRGYAYDDFFHLNEQVLSQFMHRYVPSVVSSLLPVVAEMPAGVINDIIHFAETTGILASLGIE